MFKKLLGMFKVDEEKDINNETVDFPGDLDLKKLYEDLGVEDISDDEIAEEVKLSPIPEEYEYDNIITKKKCSRCKLLLAFNFFHKDRSSDDKLQSQCIKCKFYVKRQKRRRNEN